MKKATFGTSLILLALVGGGSAHAAASSCLDCHGSVERMKAMVKMPVVSAEAGEG